MSTFEFSNRNQLEVNTAVGVSYSSKASVSAWGTSLEVSANYGDDSAVRLLIDQGGKKHRFCVGGDRSLVSQSAKLYINSMDPTDDGPCSRPGHNGARCREAS